MEEERGTFDALGGAHSAPFVDKPTGQPTEHLLDRSKDFGNAFVPGQDARGSGRAVGEDFGRKGDNTAGGDAASSILPAVAAQDKGKAVG